MPEHGARQRRVAVVGAGHVGSTFAYALLLNGLATEIVLIDVNRAKAEGEAMDLNHAMPFARPTRIWAGDYADCAGADVTVISAGAAQKPGETRLDLVKKNAAIFGEIVPQVVQHNADGALLVATNPVDVLTYVSWRLSGLPPRQVMGSGTILDTARFRYLLSEHFDVDPRSVHAYIIGEHGDTEVPVWSLANIGGMRLPAFCEAHGLDYDQEAMDDIFRRTRDAAYHIIERKGATYYAPGIAISRMVEAVVENDKQFLPVISVLDGEYDAADVTIGVPVVLGGQGVEHIIEVDLGPDHGNFEKALESVTEQIETIRAVFD